MNFLPVFLKPQKREFLVRPTYKLRILVYCFILAGISKLNAVRAQSLSDLDFLDVNLAQINFDAKLLFDKKDYREAAKRFYEILKHKPTDVQTLYNLAGCYSQLKKSDLSVKVLYNVLEAGLSDLSLFSADSIWNPIRKHESFKKFAEYVRTLQNERGEFFYTECKTIIKGFVRRPENFDSTKTYPLLILLHGYGANPESYMSLRDKMKSTDIFVAAPQGPYPRKFVELNSPAYSWYYITRNKEIWNRADPFVSNYILEVIRELKKNYKISNTYLLGHSQGGAVAYMAGIRNPDQVKGIICFGAQSPTDYLSNEDLLNASNKLPIFISHGWDDPSVNFEEAQKAKQLFLKYKFNVSFKPFQGGHELNSNALIEAKKWIDAIEAKSTDSTLHIK
jgi:phospholipase/carboxylesterase